MSNVVGLHGDLLTPAEAAQILKISAKTLAQWRSQRRGPVFIKIGGRVRYARAALDRWIAQNERGK